MPDSQMPRPRKEKRKLAYRGRYGGTWGRSSRPPTAAPDQYGCLLNAMVAHTKTEYYNVDSNNDVAAATRLARA